MGWELLTRGDETLGDAERFDDSSRIAAFLLEFGNDLGGGHVERVLAFRELVDLVRNHVKDIKSLTSGSSETKMSRGEMGRTACSKMNERGGQ